MNLELDQMHLHLNVVMYVVTNSWIFGASLSEPHVYHWG